MEADQLAFAGFDIGASSLDTRVQEILATRQRQPGTQRLKTGLSEAVLAMEAQLASLEASISHEREFSVHQQELVMRVCLSTFSDTLLCGKSCHSFWCSLHCALSGQPKKALELTILSNLK
jgi:hypothetical protein